MEIGALGATRWAQRPNIFTNAAFSRGRVAKPTVFLSLADVGRRTRIARRWQRTPLRGRPSAIIAKGKLTHALRRAAEAGGVVSMRDSSYTKAHPPNPPRTAVPRQIPRLKYYFRAPKNAHLRRFHS